MLTLLWLSLAIYTLLAERPKPKERLIHLLNVNFVMFDLILFMAGEPVATPPGLALYPVGMI
jgi:hypothetical protein